VTSRRAVIVGASHAGAQLAASLRQGGWDGPIVLIGDEGTLPYHRPPMSKAYLAGKNTLEQLAIRSAAFYTKQEIKVLDDTVQAVDRTNARVTLGSGGSLAYDRLALCTGARVRRLAAPGADLGGVHYLRTARDVELIREATSPGRRAVIIGGGYIGLETAASLNGLGMQITVLEATKRVLGRVTAPEVSAFFDRIHRDEGVVVRTGAVVEELVGVDRVRGVSLAGGETIPADIVIIGIGVEPNTGLAAAAGLQVDDGVVIDDHARTNDLDIVAAGDCTSHDMTRYGRRIRLESVPSATEQAKVAAATVCGRSQRITALPWFWSDQYDVKLQIAGINTGYDEIVLNGDPAEGRDFTCYYLQRGKLIAADCVNRPRDFVYSKQVITRGGQVDRGELTSGHFAERGDPQFNPVRGPSTMRT
jgi:3-phenylpropionate/trans-cinnamate dioxygenase ferredoxin reductase subunit